MGTSQAFVYESTVLRRWNGQLGRYIYFVGLSDFHDNASSVHKTQFSHLQELLRSVSTPAWEIGTEDISSVGVGRSEHCGAFSIQAHGSLLGDFTRYCRVRGFLTNNFEYRFCRVAALGPVLNSIAKDPHSFEPTKHISVSALIREVDAIFSELRSRNDGPVLQAVYDACIARVRTQMKQFGWYEHQNKSVADYIALVTTAQTRMSFLRSFFTFDSVLLDLRILHNVLNQNERSYLMFAGGSHTSRVAQLLTKFGYKKVQNVQSEAIREYDLKKCLGSNVVDGAYCPRPAPIDIRHLQQFFK